MSKNNNKNNNNNNNDDDTNDVTWTNDDIVSTIESFHSTFESALFTCASLLEHLKSQNAVADGATELLDDDDDDGNKRPKTSLTSKQRNSICAFVVAGYLYSDAVAAVAPGYTTKQGRFCQLRHYLQYLKKTATEQSLLLAEAKKAYPDVVMPKRKRAEKTTNKDDAQDQSADNGDDDATKSDEFAKKPKQSKSKSTTLQTFEFNSDEDDDEPTMLQRQRQQQKQPHQQQQQFLVEQPTKPLQRPAKAVTLPPPVKPFPSFASATTTPANKDPVRLPTCERLLRRSRRVAECSCSRHAMQLVSK
jgi:hypothetical protein